MNDLERLVAIEEIKQLKGRRIRALDTKDWATYEAVHASDYVSDNEGDQVYVGTKENTARLAKLYAEVDMVSVHHAHTPEIAILSATEATGIWGMEDWLHWTQAGERHWLHGFGFYHETYAKRDGQWLFTSRRLKRTKVEMSPGGAIGQVKGPERSGDERR